jgi:hypothetical protein
MIVGVKLGVDAKKCGQFYFSRKLNNGELCYASPFTAKPEDTAGTDRDMGNTVLFARRRGRRD